MNEQRTLDYDHWGEIRKTAIIGWEAAKSEFKRYKRKEKSLPPPFSSSTADNC